MKNCTHDRHLPRRRLRCLFAIALIALSFSPAARAQEEPTVFGAERQAKGFVLRPLDATLDLLYRYQYDENKPKIGEKSTFEEHRFEEIIELSTIGYIVHPNLIELDLSGSFGLTQSRTTQTGIDDSEDGTIDGYDVSALFLRKELAPLTVYSRRTHDLVTREFNGTFDRTTWTNGARLDVRSESVPTQIEIFRLDEKQDNSGNFNDFDLTQNSFLWHTALSPTDRQELNLNYAFNDISQTDSNSSSSKFRTHDASMNHTLDLDQANRHTLNSSVYYFSQSGDFALDRLRVSESLQLRHTDRFETNYEYNYDQEDRDGFDQTTHRVSGRMRHRLYDSLITTANVGGSRQEFTGGSQSDEYYADLGLHYRKMVPYGVFASTLDLRYNNQDNDQRTAPLQINDESHRFIDPNPVVLSNRGILETSIVITDPAGLIIFTELLDYTVRGFTTHVEIHRVIGGRISNGDSVLIDYLIVPEPKNTITTNSVGFGVRYTIDEGFLDGLGLYMRYFTQNQDISADDNFNFVEDQIDDLTVGVDYRRGGLFLNAEYQDHDAEINPYEVKRLSGRYQRRFANRRSVMLSGLYSITDYSIDDNQVEFLTLTGRFEQQISRLLFVGGSLSWRNEQDDNHGDTKGFEQQLDVRLEHRQTEIYAALRNSLLDADAQDRTSRSLLIGFRRDF